MTLFMILTIALLCAAFSLGGVAYLYTRYRTRLLRFVLLFLLSLLCITMGFWIDRFTDLFPGSSEASFDSASWLFQLAGGGLNIAVLPYFVACLVSITLIAPVKILLWGWNSLFILLGLSMFLFPHFSAAAVLLSLQQVLTILGALILLTAGLRGRKLRWRKPLMGFLILSGIFLIFLVLDILITLVPLQALAPLDSLSLPVYLAALTIGTFLFAGRYLSREAMVKAGKLTGECREFYGLSDREIEIVECLIDGRTNREIADGLFISPKTVENHLYNIYRKMDVGSRGQLVATLRSWEREA
jgi:DNA-binding CsgD family transcriptional regulator